MSNRYVQACPTHVRNYFRPQMIEWVLKGAAKPHPECAAWLDGSKYPTIEELEKFAEDEMCPLGLLFVDSPPLEDFNIHRSHRFSEENTRGMLLWAYEKGKFGANSHKAESVKSKIDDYVEYHWSRIREI